jgi:hypothetical protein
VLQHDVAADEPDLADRDGDTPNEGPHAAITIDIDSEANARPMAACCIEHARPRMKMW